MKKNRIWEIKYIVYFPKIKKWWFWEIKKELSSSYKEMMFDKLSIMPAAISGLFIE